MHLLYLDDSGSTKNRDEDYLVLGGVSIFEAQNHYLTQQLDALAEAFAPGNPQSLEFHASDIFSGRKTPWKGMLLDERRGVLKSVLRVLAESYDTARAFACAVHKASFPAADPLEMAFEDLCSRFDRYLGRLQAEGSRQRGLLILDESVHETTLQALATNFRVLGTKWGVVRNITEVPLFVDSRASRLVQLADHVAYAVFRRYNAGDSQYFDIIAAKFDEADGVVHGLCHKQTANPKCRCLACMSRR